MKRLIFFFFLAFVLLSCGSETAAPPNPPPSNSTQVQFVDATAQTGIDFIHISGSAEQRYILETMSAGAAFFDYDNDGHLDLFVVNGTRVEGAPPQAGNRLYHNNGDGTFNDATVSAGLQRTGWGMGCAVGDYDRDGDYDLYITHWGPNALYRNNGDGTFDDATLEAGVGDARWGTSAAFGDVDGDGYADLYVNNYVAFDLAHPPGGGEMCSGWKGLTVFCGPQGMDADADVLYRNNGDGTFADVSTQTGIDQRVYPGLGIVFFDYDNDGDLDLYVANDSTPNLFYRNDGDWRFTEVGAHAGVAYSEEGRAQAGMGVDVGDYDNDGDLDLFVTNFSDDVNTLYQNQSDGTFDDATFAANLGGLVRPYLGWSTTLADFDNDGDLDLFVANGHLYPQLENHPLGLRYAQQNLLYWNEGGTFRRATAGTALDAVQVSRGATFGDYDNDGDLDLAVVNANGPLTLLRNEGGNRANWLGLDLIGADHGETEGTLVRLFAGDEEFLRQAKRGYGYLSASDGRLLFGLGQRQTVDRVEISWPSGQVQILDNPPLRRYLIVRQDQEPVVAPYYNAQNTAPPVASATPVPQAPAAKPLTPSLPATQTWTAETYYKTITGFYRQSRYEEALSLVQIALERYPDAVRLYYAQGVTLYSGLGRYQEAAAILEQGMARDSTVVDIAKLLGVVYLNLNQPERAVTTLQRAARLDPASWEIHYQLGLAQQRRNTFANAITAFQNASAVAPQEPMPYLHLGRLYARLGREEESQNAQRRFEKLRPLREQIDRFNQAIRANPERPEAYNDLGLALAQVGRLDEAQVQLEEALARQSDYAEAHTNLGNVLQRLQQAEKAAGHYRRALEINPAQPEAHYGLGMALQTQKRSEEAIQSLQRALELRPDYIKAHTNLAVLFDAQKRQEEAIVHFQKVLDLAPDTNAYSNLIIALIRAGQIDRARDYLGRASKQRLSLPLARKALVQVLIALAYTHAEKDEIEQAVERQRQAIDLTPEKLRPPLVEKLQTYQAKQ
jgi:tetratricopeptide (TPR) repeat protein